MSDESKSVNINGKDYTEDQLTDEQKGMINHVVDLERKIQQAQFNIDQLQVARSSFMSMLESSLETEESES
jgi:hypothetical protein